MEEQKQLSMHLKKDLFLKHNLLILLIAVLLVGCFGKSHDYFKPADHESFGVEKPKPFFRKNKNIVRVCQGETSPKSLDPVSFDNKVDEITFHIFDRLVKWDDKGQIIPDLAENWVQLSNTSFQFKLRKGIKFHNGEPFSANSVKFTIERLINPKTRSPGYSLLKSINEVRIIDPYTVIINTLKPDYLFIRKLSLVQIIPESYFKKVGAVNFGKKPIGTGAYKFKEWDIDNSIVLNKNDNYWVADKPIIKTVVFKFIKVDKLSRKEQLDALFRGEVDLITELPGIHSLKVSKNTDTKIIKFPQSAKVHKMLFNCYKKPFSDIKIRKAVNVALNRDILIKVLAKGNGRKISTNSVQYEFGHDPKLKPYPYDLEEAKKLIESSGYNDIHIKIAVTDETKLIAQAVKKDLERINIQSDYDVMTVSRMAKALSSSKSDKNLSGWDYDLTIYSGIDPFLHVGFLYGLALYSQGPFSTTNSKAVDKIYEKLIVTLDKAQQQKLCYDLENLSYLNYSYTPVFQVIDTYGAAKDLQLNNTATSFVDLSTAYFKDL